MSVYNSDLLSQYKNVYDVLFICNMHIYHSHPDTNTIYGIKDNKRFNIGKFDANKSFTPFNISNAYIISCLDFLTILKYLKYFKNGIYCYNYFYSNY